MAQPIVVNIVLSLASELLDFHDREQLALVLTSLLQQIEQSGADFSSIASALYACVSDNIADEHFWADLPMFTWQVCILMSHFIASPGEQGVAASPLSLSEVDPVLVCYPSVNRLNETQRGVLQQCFFRLMAFHLRPEKPFEQSFAIAWHVCRLLAESAALPLEAGKLNYRFAIVSVCRVFQDRCESGVEGPFQPEAVAADVEQERLDSLAPAVT